jgi:hypothetical protein
MKWITREKGKLDRVARPRLIRELVDPGAELLFVPAAEVTAVAAREPPPRADETAMAEIMAKRLR